MCEICVRQDAGIPIVCDHCGKPMDPENDFIDTFRGGIYHDDCINEVIKQMAKQPSTKCVGCGVPIIEVTVKGNIINNINDDFYCNPCLKEAIHGPKRKQQTRPCDD